MKEQKKTINKGFKDLTQKNNNYEFDDLEYMPSLLFNENTHGCVYYFGSLYNSMCRLYFFLLW